MHPTPQSRQKEHAPTKKRLLQAVYPEENTQPCHREWAPVRGEMVENLHLSQNPTILDAELPCPAYGVQQLQSLCGTQEDACVAGARIPSFPQAATKQHQSTLFQHGGSCANESACGVYPASTAWFFGVFDGHNGPHVAQFCAHRLHVELAAVLNNDTTVGPEGDSVPCLQRALFQAFSSVDAAAERCLANTSSSGCTACAAVLSAHNVVIASAGDSRAVLCRSGCAMPLTEDQRPDRADEAERVSCAGGTLLWNAGALRVEGVLGTTRAIGDTDLREYGVICTPEVRSVKRCEEDDFLLLASDGLFNVLSNDEAVMIIQKVMRRALEKGGTRASAVRIAADVVSRYARDRKSKDDITAIVIDLKQSSSSPSQVLSSACNMHSLPAHHSPVPQPLNPVSSSPERLQQQPPLPAHSTALHQTTKDAASEPTALALIENASASEGKRQHQCNWEHLLGPKGRCQSCCVSGQPLATQVPLELVFRSGSTSTASDNPTGCCLSEATSSSSTQDLSQHTPAVCRALHSPLIIDQDCSADRVSEEEEGEASVVACLSPSERTSGDTTPSPSLQNYCMMPRTSGSGLNICSSPAHLQTRAPQQPLQQPQQQQSSQPPAIADRAEGTSSCIPFAVLHQPKGQHRHYGEH